MAFALYIEEVGWLSEITEALRQARWPRANRSQVIREAILRLKDQLAGKDAADIAEDFSQHQYQRSRSRKT